MAVPSPRRNGSVRLAQGFEGSRLAAPLLALAYQTLLPILVPSAPLPSPQAPTDLSDHAAAAAAIPFDTEVLAHAPPADPDGRPVRPRLL